MTDHCNNLIKAFSVAIFFLGRETIFKYFQQPLRFVNNILVVSAQNGDTNYEIIVAKSVPVSKIKPLSHLFLEFYQNCVDLKSNYQRNLSFPWVRTSNKLTKYIFCEYLLIKKEGIFEGNWTSVCNESLFTANPTRARETKMISSHKSRWKIKNLKKKLRVMEERKLSSRGLDKELIKKRFHT